MNNNSRINQRGLSLIELMIAILLGLFITGGMIQLFVNSNQSYRIQENLSRLQENGRFAMEFITRDIRMAGYMGCGSKATTNFNTLNDEASFNVNFASAIQGSESTDPDNATWLPALDSSITSPLNGHDIITIRGIFTQGINILGQPDVSPPPASPTCENDASLKISKSTLFAVNDIVIAANCESSTVFQITQLNAGTSEDEVIHEESHPAANESSYPGNKDTNLQHCYATQNGQLFKLSTRVYYIRLNEANQPSLYRKDGNQPAQELVEGIEDMQILYGEDTDADGTPNYYHTADTVLDMDKVVSIKISLLAKSLEDNLASSPVSYILPASPDTTTGEQIKITPTDRKIRRVFTSTIAVRNRLLD